MASGKEPVETKDLQDVENTAVRVQTSTSVGPDKPYTIFTKKQKVAIIVAAAIASFFSPMSANIYVPALNSVAADFHVSNTQINLTLTTYLVCGPSLIY
jgi:hypothetical protein